MSIALLFILAGCAGGLKIIDPSLELENDYVNEEDSVVDELTPIIIIGPDVSVATYRCNTSTDCNRCQGGDVYGQACISEICQGSLDLVEVCEDKCSAGQCVEDDVLTGEEIIGSYGEDFDLAEDPNATVKNVDLLPDETQCSPGTEKCPGTQGIGNIYLTQFPECKCTYIYVPSGCNPNEPPCFDYSSRSAYPECACSN